MESEDKAAPELKVVSIKLGPVDKEEEQIKEEEDEIKHEIKDETKEEEDESEDEIEQYSGSHSTGACSSSLISYKEMRKHPGYAEFSKALLGVNLFNINTAVCTSQLELALFRRWDVLEDIGPALEDIADFGSWYKSGKFVYAVVDEWKPKKGCTHKSDWEEMLGLEDDIKQWEHECRAAQRKELGLPVDPFKRTVERQRMSDVSGNAAYSCCLNKKFSG